MALLPTSTSATNCRYIGSQSQFFRDHSSDNEVISSNNIFKPNTFCELTDEYVNKWFTKSDVSFESSPWNYNPSDGSFGAKRFAIATVSQVSWDRFTGTADNKDNPMKLTGKRYEGNVNNATNVEEMQGEFEMTRRQ